MAHSIINGPQYPAASPDLKPVCFTIALNGYDEIWAPCLATHAAYSARHGYVELVINDLPWAITPRQAAWLKVEIINGLLGAGVPLLAFFDADCEIRPFAPDFRGLFEDGTSLMLAPGKSGRINSGVVFAKNTPGLRDFIQLLISKADQPVATEDATAYENGHFIHYGRHFGELGRIEHRLWNNNSALDATSYVQHYSGGDLRRHYEAAHRNRVSTKRSAHDYHERQAMAGAKPDLGSLQISEFFDSARDYLNSLYARVKSACLAVEAVEPDGQQDV